MASRGSYAVSIVDATNVTVSLQANASGLEGTELPTAIEGDAKPLDRLERIRAACVELGLVDDPGEVPMERPTMPFIAVVSPPQGYVTSVDGHVTAEDVDITTRVVSTGRPHHAHATTGAMYLAASTRSSGTIRPMSPRNRGYGTDRLSEGNDPDRCRYGY